MKMINACIGYNKERKGGHLRIPVRFMKKALQNCECVIQNYQWFMKK